MINETNDKLKEAWSSINIRQSRLNSSRTSINSRDQEEYLIMIKGSIYQKDTAILNMYLPTDKASKYMTQKLFFFFKVYLTLLTCLSRSCGTAICLLKFPVMTLRQTGIEGNFFNLINDIYKKPIVNITRNGEKLNAFPSMIKIKARMSNFTTSVQHSTRGSSQCNKART